MSLRHCFINKKGMKTNHLFLLAIALISLLFTAYVIIAIISIAENPVWETVQTHLTTPAAGTCRYVLSCQNGR